MAGLEHSTCVEVRGQLCVVGSLLYVVLGLELRPPGLHGKHFYPLSHAVGPGHPFSSRDR